MSLTGRTDKVIRNGMWSTLSYIVTVLVGMYCQRVFILELGYDLYGLNAMFTSIVTMLSVTELGIGTAIVFSLYKPLAVHDKKKISALISLYKKIYRIIGIIILGGSLTMIPAIPKLTGFTIKQFIIPYLIFVCNTSLTYFFTYNQTLLNADQKNYIVSIQTCLVKISYNILQIICIYATHNFALYTLLNFLCVLLGNLFLSHIVKKQYPYLKKYEKEKLKKEETTIIKTKVLALIYHKIGAYLVTGGDNFIISGFLGVATVGYYSNYTFVTNTLKSLILSVVSGFTSGFGNLIAVEDGHKNIKVFKSSRFVYFVLYGTTSVCLFCCIEPFLKVLYTEETILPTSVLWLVVLNYFVYGYSACYGDFRSAAGVFEPDRFLCLIMPIANVIISIVLVRRLGIEGVLIGTFLCYAFKECTVVPWVCSKYIFQSSPYEFWARMWIDTFFTMTIVFLCSKLCGTILVTNLWLQFFINGSIGVLFSVISITLVYGRTEEYRFVAKTLKNKIIGRLR